MSNEDKTPNDEDQKPQANIQDLQAQLKTMQDEIAKRDSTNERLLDESKKNKAKYKQYEADEEAKVLAAKFKEEDSLRQQGEFKKLLEQREAELSSMSEKLQTVESEKMQYVETLVEGQKLSEFERKLGGKIKHKDYYGLINTKDIALNPETGEIDERSVDIAVQSFLAQHKDLVAFNEGKLPNYAGGGASGGVSVKDYKNMSYKDKLANLKDAHNKYANKK